MCFTTAAGACMFLYDLHVSVKIFCIHLTDEIRTDDRQHSLVSTDPEVN